MGTRNRRRSGARHGPGCQENVLAFALSQRILIPTLNERLAHKAIILSHSAFPHCLAPPFYHFCLETKFKFSRVPRYELCADAVGFSSRKPQIHCSVSAEILARLNETRFLCEPACQSMSWFFKPHAGWVPLTPVVFTSIIITIIDTIRFNIH